MLTECIKVVASATALFILLVLGFAIVIAFVLLLSWKEIDMKYMITLIIIILACASIYENIRVFG